MLLHNKKMSAKQTLPMFQRKEVVILLIKIMTEFATIGKRPSQTGPLKAKTLLIKIKMEFATTALCRIMPKQRKVAILLIKTTTAFVTTDKEIIAETVVEKDIAMEKVKAMDASIVMAGEIEINNNKKLGAPSRITNFTK